MDQMKRMRKVMANPSESEQLRALAGSVAELERNQRAAMREHLEALGHEDAVEALPELPDHEERVSQFCEAVACRVQSSRSPWDVWAEHYAPDALDTDAARAYAGLNADEWEDDRARWVEQYREKGVPDEYDDEELVELYVSNTFGVPLQTFEKEVIGWDEATVYRRVLVGELEAHTDALEAATNEIGDDSPGCEAGE
jgi:hypothetical protein